jgi:hypothetical protein
VDLKKSRAGGKSLKRYEITNLLFFLVLIIALGVLVSFVFRYYGNRNQPSPEETELGVISDALSEGSDMGLFYLDTRLSETTRQYRSRLEIPATDDGLVRELFNLPGIEEVTIDQQTIILKKNGSVRWDAIQSRVRQIVKNHLHTHY